MPIVQQGSINTTALIVPDLYVQIVPPQVTLLNGVPTNVLGVVGTAQWGPVNSPTIIGDMAAYARTFGSVQNRKYDMGTAVAAAVINGANNFRCVRVTDGTDVAATAVVQTNCLTFTAKYTGTLGNTVVASLAAGSAANTWKVTVAAPTLAPEVFDNIGAGLTGNALWAAIAAAINNGNGIQRGASQIVTATAGAGVAAPVAASFTLASGTDGATTITGSVLVGQDTVPRKGMYALRNQGVSVAMLTDCDDSTTFSTQSAFGLSEGIYMIGVGPAGDTIANAVTTKTTAGIDSYSFKWLFGDWIWFLDTVNGVTRLISPQGFVAGLLANLSPEQSSLNKQLFGVVGTQKSYANQTYSAAELQTLAQAGYDVITNPVPGGNYFGCRIGHNTSSNSLTYGDNYTRLTNYIAATLNAGMGKFVGRLQTVSERGEARAGVSNFLSNMEQQGMIGSVNGGPAYSVVLDGSNNPDSRVALGYQQADVKVRFLSVIEKFIINVEGSQATVIRSSTAVQ